MAQSVGDVVGRHEQVDVIGHNDKGVELVEALGSVVLERFEKELGVLFNLK